MNESLLRQIEILNSTVKVHKVEISRLEERVTFIEKYLCLTGNGIESLCPRPDPDTPIHPSSRTCFDALKLNPSLQSGFYMIDPDGENIGRDPIKVFCDMTTGIEFFFLIVISSLLFTCKITLFPIRINYHQPRQHSDVREFEGLFLSRMFLEFRHLRSTSTSNRSVGDAIWIM